MAAVGIALAGPSRTEINVRRIPDRALLTLGAFLLAVLCALTLAAAAHSSWPRLAGNGSVFGNDPARGVHDASDSGRTALGTPTARGGIAVMRYGTLGGWWWVCAPRQILGRDVRRCHLVRQTDIGPAPWTGRVIDVTSVTARRAWRLPTAGFPTDVGRWTLRYRGRR